MRRILPALLLAALFALPALAAPLSADPDIDAAREEAATSAQPQAPADPEAQENVRQLGNFLNNGLNALQNGLNAFGNAVQARADAQAEAEAKEAAAKAEAEAQAAAERIEQARREAQIPAPRLGVGLPGLTLNPVDPTDTDAEGRIVFPWIQQFVTGFYRYAIGITGILAVIMIMAGGVIWITAGGSSTRLETAKSFIGSALLGLLLAMFSFLILYTINPALVQPQALRVQQIVKIGGSFSFGGFAEKDKFVLSQDTIDARVAAVQAGAHASDVEIANYTNLMQKAASSGKVEWTVFSKPPSDILEQPVGTPYTIIERAVDNVGNYYYRETEWEVGTEGGRSPSGVGFSSAPAFNQAEYERNYKPVTKVGKKKREVYRRWNFDEGVFETLGKDSVARNIGL